MLSGRHAVRCPQGARDGDHRVTGADKARCLRRHRGLRRRGWRHGHRDRDPYGRVARRPRLRPGRSRHRRGLRPRPRGRGVPQQGRSGHRSGRRGDDAATPRRMTGRRGLAVTLSCWVAAAGVALWSAGRVWGSVTVRAENGVRVHAHVTGHDVAAGVAPSAVALLALVVAVVAASGWMRRACGALAVIIGVVIAAAAVAGQRRIDTALADKIFAAPGAAVHPPATVWPWLAVAAGLLAAACGVVTAVYGPGWSGLGRRYDAPGAHTEVADDDASRWAALDRGEDPTA